MRTFASSKRSLSAVLALVLVLSSLAGCSLFKNDKLNRVSGKLASANEAEQAMNVTAALSIEYYLTARAQLDTFLACDAANLDAEGVKELTALLNSTIATFEDVEKLSVALNDSVDVWENTPDNGKGSYELLAAQNRSFGFGFVASAADQSSAQKWAQDIVDAYDKAPAGKGVRTLAAHLGTDAQHAYAQLKQALAVLDGAEYTAIADKANTAVQVATGLKAAGTAAGLVIAVAAAPAATTIGAVAQTGGIVCSGVNTILEVGSAGAIIYHNGEDNEISIACDNTEAQFAPVGQVFSIMGVGQSLKDVGSTGKSILENGYKSLSEKDKQELGMNSFSLLSSAGSSLSDYANGGTILSGTFTKTDKGVEFTLVDTLTGTDKSSVENVKTVLKEAGIDKKTVETALKNAHGEAPDGNIPADIAKDIMEKNAVITTADASAVDSVVNTVSETLTQIENQPQEADEVKQHDIPSIDDEIHVPDDAFEGDYAEFTGKDGSVTRVFDNGSVSTKNPDGSVTAVDYEGNQYSEDKDGNTTVRTTDGYTASENADGSKSLTEPNGKTTTVKQDGSFSEDYGVGITLDYNADGGLTGIGITGSDERIGTDENGNYQNGEIKGPNGSKLTISDDGMQFVNGDGTVYDHTDLGDKQTTTIRWKDGSHAESETSVTWDGNGRTENTDYTLTDSDGNRWDSNVNVTYDADGNPISSNNNVTQWTGEDGSTLWVDNNSQAMQYSDQDGNKMFTDANGNLTEYQDGQNSWNVSYDENGNVTSADISFADGAKMVANPDGTSTFTLPDGTEYMSDGNGNVFKDGDQLKQDGEWLEKPDAFEESSTQETPTDSSIVSGASPSAMMGSWTYSSGSVTENYNFTLSGNSVTVVMTAKKSDGTMSEPVTFTCSYTYDGETMTISNERWKSEMKLRLIEGGKLEVTSSGTFVMTRMNDSLSAEAIAGTYFVSGYDAWDDFEDDFYDWKDPASVNLIVKANGPNSLTFTADGISQPISNYDPTTGACSYSDETGMVIHVQFSVSGSTYSINVAYDETYPEGRSYGAHSGTKK